MDTSTGKQVAANNKAYVFDGAQSVSGSAVTDLAAADFTDVDKVVTFINAVSSNTAATGMDYLIVVNDDTALKSAIYHVENATTDAVAAAEISLLSVTEGVVVAADFIA